MNGGSHRLFGSKRANHSGCERVEDKRVEMCVVGGDVYDPEWSKLYETAETYG